MVWNDVGSLSVECLYCHSIELRDHLLPVRFEIEVPVSALLCFEWGSLGCDQVLEKRLSWCLDISFKHVFIFCADILCCFLITTLTLLMFCFLSSQVQTVKLWSPFKAPLGPYSNLVLTSLPLKRFETKQLIFCIALLCPIWVLQWGVGNVTNVQEMHSLPIALLLSLSSFCQ